MVLYSQCKFYVNRIPSLKVFCIKDYRVLNIKEGLWYRHDKDLQVVLTWYITCSTDVGISEIGSILILQ